MLVIYGTAYEQVPGSGRRTKFGSHSTKSAPTPSTIVPAVADTPTPELLDLASKNTGRPFTFELQINKEYFFSRACPIQYLRRSLPNLAVEGQVDRCL